jgi:hypothetical protein
MVLNMRSKSKFPSLTLIGFYKIFLGLAIFEGFLVLWFLFRIPSDAESAFFAGYSRLRIEIGTAAMLVMAVFILLFLDSFLSKRFLKFLGSMLASLLSKDVNRTIIKTFFAIVLIISIPLAEEFNFTSLKFASMGRNTLFLIGVFIGWFFLITIKTFTLTSLWLRKFSQPPSNTDQLIPGYYKDALIIFCLLAFVFAYFYQDGGWNGNSRFDLIFAIVKERRLTIDTFQNKPGTDTGDKAYYKGHYYSDKAIGPAVVGAILYEPLYWIKQIFDRGSQIAAEKILTYSIVGLPSAIAGCLIYVLCLYLSKSRFRSYLVTLTITLGTLYFPYSSIFYSHQFTSSLLFSAFFLIFYLKEKPEKWKNWYSFLVGSLLGWSLISEYQAAIIVLALASYYLYVIWRNRTYHHPRSIILPILGGLIPVLLQMVYNKACFGNFLAIGYINESDPNFNSAMAQGIMGIHWPSLSVLYYMTLHPTAGIFWESPALAFSIAGIVYMFLKHRYRVEAILAIWIIGAYLVIMSGYYMWWGGFAVGPRFLIPMLPFFCIFLAFIPRQLNWPLVLLSLVSIGQMLITAAGTVQAPDGWVSRIGTQGFFSYSNIYSYCLKYLEKGRFTPNLGHQFLGLESWNSLIPLLVVIGVVTGFFFWKRKEIAQERGFQPINS